MPIRINPVDPTLPPVTSPPVTPPPAMPPPAMPPPATPPVTTPPVTTAPVTTPPVTMPTLVTPTTPMRQIGDLPYDRWERLMAQGRIPSSEWRPCYDAALGCTATAITQAIKESSLGADASAQQTFNPLGIMVFDKSRPCIPVFGGQLCLRRYDRWSDAFATYRRLVLDVEDPYLPADITVEDFLATYVGGPGCRASNGGNCANGETWRGRGTTTLPPEPANYPGNSIGLYIAQTVKRINDTIGGTTPAAPPQRDPIDVVVGGRPYRIEYGFGDDAGLPYYPYGVGHGTSRPTQHTGLDILVPYGTPLFTPIAGRVTCVGGQGEVTWGQGCGAFNDTGDAPPGSPTIGVGNITVLGDNGVKLVFGHSRQATVHYNQRVNVGDQVATSGGQNGAHCHFEAAVERNGAYWLVEPRAALGGTPGHAERLPFTEPAQFATVSPRPGAKVYQRADPDAVEVSTPFDPGETFQTGILTLGEDGEWWFVGSRLGRVRVADCPGWEVRHP